MKLASIEKIHSFSVHPNADALVKAKILGWPVVVKKDEFKDGDLVVFIFPDVLVDKDNPYFKFMESRKWRVWQARFRKEPSAGLVCPLSVLDFYGVDKANLTVGQDVGAVMKLEKFEKQIDLKMNDDAVGGFPSHLVRMTDEDNLLSYPEVESEFKNKECYLSLKADGSSLSIIYNNGELKVCSRRLELKEGEGVFWRAAKKYNLPEKLKNLNKNLAIQMECCGPKLNGNALGLSDIEIFVFNVKDLDTNEYFGLDKLTELTKNLEIPMVKVIQKFTYDETWNIDKIKEITNNLKYDNGAWAEGVVLRPVIPVYSSILNKELSVKLISENYKD